MCATGHPSLCGGFPLDVAGPPPREWPVFSLSATHSERRVRPDGYEYWTWWKQRERPQAPGSPPPFCAVESPADLWAGRRPHLDAQGPGASAPRGSRPRAASDCGSCRPISLGLLGSDAAIRTRSRSRRAPGTPRSLSLGVDGYIAMLWEERETGQRKLMARVVTLGERRDASFPTP